MTLAGAIYAIGPVQAGVEPLRAVGRRHLLGQHHTHFVKIGAGILFGAEIATFPAPVGPGAGETIKHLPGAGLTAFFNVIAIGHRAPEKLGNVFFFDLFQARGHAGLAEIFLCDDIAGNLAPSGRHFDLIQTENDLAIRIANLGAGGFEVQRSVGVLTGGGEFTFDFHFLRCPIIQLFRVMYRPDIAGRLPFSSTAETFPFAAA